jgi:hypothetical protein
MVAWKSMSMMMVMVLLLKSAPSLGQEVECRDGQGDEPWSTLLLHEFTFPESGGYNQLRHKYSDDGSLAVMRIEDGELMVQSGAERGYWFSEWDIFCIEDVANYTHLEMKVRTLPRTDFGITLEYGDGPLGCGDANWTWSTVSFSQFATPDGSLQQLRIPLTRFGTAYLQSGLHSIGFGIAGGQAPIYFDDILLADRSCRTVEPETSAPPETTMLPPMTNATGDVASNDSVVNEAPSSDDRVAERYIGQRTGTGRQFKR